MRIAWNKGMHTALNNNFHIGNNFGVQNKGRKHTTEEREKISAKAKGRIVSSETKRKMSIAATGRKHTLEAREKMQGSNSPHWKGGKGSERHREMRKLEYRIWREAVFARDNWTCVSCEITNCYLEADHIKPWALYPELRYAIDNGRTLCKPCHMQTETYPKSLKGGYQN